MIRLKWTLAALAIAVLAACTQGGSPAFVQDLDDVAIIVLDDFSAKPQAAAPTGRENCFYTGQRANEVGSGGGGDGLPTGVSHGKAVSEVLRAELNDGRHRLNADNKVGSGGGRVAGSWKFGGHQITVIEVDTAGFNTEVTSNQLESLLGELKDKRIVLNMSFLILPCDVFKWFAANNLTVTVKAVVAAYRTAIDVMQVRQLHDTLDRLVRNNATIDTLLSDPNLAKVTPAIPVNLFYSTFEKFDISEVAKGSNVTIAAKAAYDQLASDPLHGLLAGQKQRVVPVGAAGNGLIPSGKDKVETEERIRIPFPFAPALWGSVISVSAVNNMTGKPRGNDGEIMMNGEFRTGIFGSSFAAPRLSAMQAVYLFTGGPGTCQEHTPPLGYTDLDGSRKAGWKNVPLVNTRSPSGAVSQFCPEFLSRMVPRDVSSSSS